MTTARSASTASRCLRACGRALLGCGELLGARTRLGGQELGAQLVRLALEAGVDVGGLGLLLQRAQAAAGLALDVERAVEIVLRALQPKLGAAAALAVLREAGGLLDQDAAVARLRVDDLLDAALADDGVHLAAEVHVGEDVDDVGQAAASAVEAVFAVTGCDRGALRIETSENPSGSSSPSSVARTTSTSA